MPNPMDSRTKVLSNEGAGINFYEMAKPTNLHNSAVLRMLEEEENAKKNGQYRSFKRVAWPPPPDGEDFLAEVDPNEEEASTRLNGTNPNSPANQQQARSQNPSQTPTKGWNQVSSSPAKPQKVVEPPPSTVTLLPLPPISQAPAPVYTSQPATATLRGGVNMRGDQKWPPAEYKAQADAENEARIMLAKGPAFRPKKVKKDYSSFFAQNALNSTYPGYKAPPGTQHYTDQPGISNL